MTLVFLFFAAVLAGGLNSVAGGGSFITFPSLLFAGITPVVANATNTVALWPGTLASVAAYRRDLDQSRALLVALTLSSLVGGLIGALLLLNTPDRTFVRLLPWLLLAATLVLSLGPRRVAHREGFRLGPVPGALVQLVIATYGGYFGGGMGILMLATFSLLGMTHIHAMNGLKTLLATVINGVAVLVFVGAGKVAWEPGLVMVVGATFGGYYGATIARRMNPVWIKRLVLLIAWGMTVYFFLRSIG
jgi:uncharacterized membrane protein YfcA